MSFVKKIADLLERIMNFLTIECQCPDCKKNTDTIKKIYCDLNKNEK